MGIKVILKNLAALLIFIISGISAGMAVTMYLFDTIPLIEQSTVPDNPVGIVILPFLALTICIFTAIILSIILFCLKRKVKLSLLLFRKKERKLCILLRISGYLIITKLIYDSICDILKFKQFFINGLWYYSSAVVFVLAGMLIVMAIVVKNSDDF